MSISQSSQLRPYTAFELIEEATSRAGIGPEKLTSEIVEKSLDQLNLIFTQLLNRGVQLWKRQRLILPCYLNTANVLVPPGVNVVERLVRRSLSRQTGTVFSSAGGTASNAFDGDLTTSCVQVSDDGNLGLTLASPNPVTTCGVYFTSDLQVSFFVEYSLDGATNWTALNAWTGTVSANSWVWLDLDGAPAALGWRIRASGSSAPLSIGELYFGYMPTEIPLEPWNLDDYNSMPDKTTPGQVLNYYQQRNIDGVVLMVWPVPNGAAIFDTLVVWAHYYIDTVSTPAQSMDFPQRWYDAVTAMLARRLCRSLPEADVKRYDMLRQEEEDAVTLAEGEERDYSNSNYDMGLDAYTA